MKSLVSSLFVAFLSLSSITASATPAWETIPVAQPLPPQLQQGRVEHGGASIWYGVVGAGQPVILLHGGRASSLSWGNQIGALVERHHQVILIDSRGHGRSTLGAAPLSYELMETDVLAVMDALKLKKAAVAGWSDGAIIGLVMAMKHPGRVSKVFAFGPNMNSRFLTAPVNSPVLPLLGPRLAVDYASVARDPAAFEHLGTAVRAMQKTQPDYSDAQLAAIKGPAIAIVGGDHDEFINKQHFEYLAATIPGARLITLRDVSHFAPWQDAPGFNATLIDFLDR
jgi:pimeloyl-ACP methyl ester carboxylesterase